MSSQFENEKLEDSFTSSPMESRNSTTLEDESPPTPSHITRESIYEPIRLQKSEAGTRPGSLKEISRTRSQNGYGCDSEQEEADIERAGGDRDPWEVTWDNGDLDPMNPRSMAFAKKWAIVIIVSAASLCV